MEEFTMKMSTNDYYKYREIIRDWHYDKEGLQRLYDEIFYKYEDGAEMLRDLDKYNSHWTMDLH